MCECVAYEGVCVCECGVRGCMYVCVRVWVTRVYVCVCESVAYEGVCVCERECGVRGKRDKAIL